MRVLHVNNVAFVGLTLAKYMRRLGVESFVVQTIEDPIGEMLHAGIKSLLDKEMAKAIVLTNNPSHQQHEIYKMSNQADIIHVHSAPMFIPILRKHFPDKKIVLTLHGSDVRLRGWRDIQSKIYEADMVTVSTPDLLELPNTPSFAMHIANPVDTEHFTRKVGVEPIPDTMLYIHRKSWGNSVVIEAVQQAIKFGCKLVMYEHGFIVPYIWYPRFLERYEYLYDFKMAEYMDTEQAPPLPIRNPWHAESLTALQFRSLGGQSIYRGKRRVGVPDKHHPEKVARRWLKLYEGL